MRNTVPPSTVVLKSADVGSLNPSLSTGKPLVDPTTQDAAPGRLEMTFPAISSISTLARPSALCPVTTRRICRLMAVPSLFDASALEERSKDLRHARLGVAPFLAVPFLQQLVVRALFDHIIVQLAVRNELGG